MKMSKTNKKIDNNICKALTDVCEQAKVEVSGFQWLTHTANYTQFPGSLMVTCVFEDEASMMAAQEAELDFKLQKLVQKSLFKVGVVLKDARQNLRLDNEDACERENTGDWPARLQQKSASGYRKNRPASRSRY